MTLSKWIEVSKFKHETETNKINVNENKYKNPKFGLLKSIVQMQVSWGKWGGIIQQYLLSAICIPVTVPSARYTSSENTDNVPDVIELKFD